MSAKNLGQLTTAGGTRPWPSGYPRRKTSRLTTAVRLSGLTKQDYITRRLLDRAVVVQGNPRVYKALRDQLAAVLGELRRIEAGGDVGDELLATIDLISVTLGGMKED